MNAAGTPANRDRLLRNDCAGGFHEATTAAGLYPPSATEYRGALAVLGAHLDTDLWPDIYVVNVTYGTADPASQLDQIYRNQGGTRIGDDAQWGMGMDVADIDHNGTWDIYISDLLWDTPLEEPPWGNVLYLGTPSGGFTDNQASNAGVVGDDSWGVNFLDVDHDGWEDLFITTMLGAEGEFLFANNGDGTFTNVAGRAGIATGNSRGSAVADYDRDGDLDIALVNHTYCLERPASELQVQRIRGARCIRRHRAAVLAAAAAQRLSKERQLVAAPPGRERQQRRGDRGGRPRRGGGADADASDRWRHRRTFAEQPGGPLRARTNRDGGYGRGPLAEWPAHPLGQPAGQHADRGSRGRRLSQRRSGRLHRRGQRAVGLTSIELGA